MKPEAISTEEFDRRFDAGEDMSDFIDWTKTGRSGSPDSSILRIPESLLTRIDLEAQRLGMTRQALIERWLIERLDDAA